MNEPHAAMTTSPTPFQVLAVIPARGGSKGVPRKNVMPMAGEPLLAHIVRAARQAATLTRVVVSTDDAEIAGVAQRYGAEVVWRPADISGDTATSEQALLHALDHLRQAEGYVPDILVYLQCTSPLTMAEDIDGVVDALIRSGADTALAVMPFHYFIWHGPCDDAAGVNHMKLVRPRRQDREAQYLEAGAVVVMRVPGFLKEQLRFYGRTALYEMPPERCLEIDEPADVLIAEARLRERLKHTPLAALPSRPSAVVFDFDGVFTDNKVYVSETGAEMVACSRSDGFGLAELRALGLPLLVLSTEVNPVVEQRCRKLNVPCLSGQTDKALALGKWLEENKLEPLSVIYVGNDINDLGCLRLVGGPVAVADSVPEVLRAARLVLRAPGGQGAVRELCRLVAARLAGQ
ncbi:MAG: acylneuraminate cytidylyltransferase [Anaerolineales bacterium]|nr:acylneuraminate cytidylyltransferase [Anaerolineales bacterium]